MPIVDLHGVVKLEKIYKMASVDKTCKVTNQLENSKDPHHSHLLIKTFTSVECLLIIMYKFIYNIYLC